ncbi:MAG: YhcH/YjgK/YiaL family protein, partial [Armatimonadota bacterium]|nr:YhcH/YjgK/YiaL family protein [Armatimonadota bacterium]
NASLYYGLGSKIEAALKYLQNTDFSALEPGRYDIQGTEIYALVQDYETKPMGTSVWEAHRKYIDVQYIANGAERMGCANIEDMKGFKITSEYNEAKDVMKFEGEGDFFLAKAGTFAIFMPHDEHMPCMAVSDPQPVRKVVVKVRV